MVMYYVFRFLAERRERMENAELEEKKLLKELVGSEIESEE